MNSIPSVWLFKPLLALNVELVMCIAWIYSRGKKTMRTADFYTCYFLLTLLYHDRVAGIFAQVQIQITKISCISIDFHNL